MTRVLITDQLQSRHTQVAEGLRRMLGDYLGVIHGTRDLWCRDYMPVQVAPRRFVQFRYDPSYLRDDPARRTQDAHKLVALNGTITHSERRIDGGNVVMLPGRVALLTDRIYGENPGHSRQLLRDEIRRLLEVDRVVIIPCEPGDIIGHADGMARIVDERTVLVNDYTAVDATFGRKLEEHLRRGGFDMVRFPYCPADEPGSDPGIPSAAGMYINFLQVEGLIICPTFGRREDDQAMKVLEQRFPCTRVLPLDCRTLAAEGGVLNCATWQVWAKCSILRSTSKTPRRLM